MPRGRAFEDLLDEHLSSRGGDVRAAARPGPAGTAVAYGFFLFDGVSGRGIAMAGPAPVNRTTRLPRTGVEGVCTSGVRTRPATAYAGSSAPVCSDPVTMRRRVLSAREQAALDLLVSLGAPLHPASSPRELRSAFRALARQYHPDRHTGCSDEERTRVGRIFTGVYDAYRVLAGTTQA